MLPNPLHPALVHFPIVLALLLPLVVAAAFVAMRRGVPAKTAWWAPLALAVLLLASTWLTVEAGENEEETVEDVVAHDPFEEHEEAGKRFLVLSVVGVLVVAAGVAPGRAGQWGRGAGAVMSLVLAVAVYGVGKTGGALVYEQGAAQAYTSATAGATGESQAGAATRDRDDDDEDDDDDDAGHRL